MTHHFLTVSILPLSRSLERNGIGAEGATALAAILNETKITHLKCAAAPQCLLPCQRPLTRLITTLLFPVLAVCKRTTSAPREEPLSLTG